MKLHYAETLNPRKACAVARHLEAPVEFVRVDLGKGEHTSPAFKALNPNAKVPVLEIDGESLWESNAIMCRLAQVMQSDLWPQDGRQIDVIRWLCWDMQHFSKYAGSLYFEYIIKPMFDIGPPDGPAVEEATGYVRRYATVLNDHLRGRRWLVGDSPTVADFAVAITLPYAEQAHIPLQEFSEVERWHDRLGEMPAWRDPFGAAAA